MKKILAAIGVVTIAWASLGAVFSDTATAADWGRLKPEPKFPSPVPAPPPGYDEAGVPTDVLPPINCKQPHGYVGCYKSLAANCFLDLDQAQCEENASAQCYEAYCK